MTQKLLLENNQAPGDLMVMSAAIRALHQTYPGEYATYVKSSCPDVWKNNPFVKTDNDIGLSKHIKLGYSAGINRSNQTSGHFVNGFVAELADKLNRPIEIHDMRPHMPLEASEGPVKGLEPGTYWVMMAGGKKDFTAKMWGFSQWRQLVKLTPGVKWVQAGSKNNVSIQSEIPGTVNLVGKTSLREFIRLVAYSKGIACHVTCGMHAAAAFNKPCVVVGGGREPWWWEAYNHATWLENCSTPVPSDFVPHAYLHTMGKLPCCRHHGCWKAGLGEKRHNNCVNVVKRVERVPHCMTLIEPEDVARIVSAYESTSSTTPIRIPEVLNEIPDWLKPRITPADVRKRRKQHTPRTPKKKVRKQYGRNTIRTPVTKIYDAPAEGRAPTEPAPAMRKRDVVPTRRSSMFDKLELVVSPTPEFPAGFKACVDAAVRYSQGSIVEKPSGNTWCVWLAPGVRPTAPGWLYVVAQAAGAGRKIIAGAASGWVAASPDIVSGLKGADWRTLLNKAHRVKGIRMRAENPKEIV